MMLCSSISSTFPRLILPSRKPVAMAGRNGRGDVGIFHPGHRRMRWRGISVETRAGLSATTYIAAFVLPLSLLAGTILTSMKIADDLDEKFFEELAINEAILEAEENAEDGDIDGVNITLEQEPTPTPTPTRRNRPKREVEPSSSK